MCLPQHAAGSLFHKKPPPHKIRLICLSDGDGTQQVGGLEGRAGGIVGRPVVGANVSMGCCLLFRTRDFAGSAAHRPDDTGEG